MKKYLSIKATSEYTGLSQYYLRNGCKDGSVPCVNSGTKYYINIEALLENLEEKSKRAV